jgi:hypothetical protein
MAIANLHLDAMAAAGLEREPNDASCGGACRLDDVPRTTDSHYRVIAYDDIVTLSARECLTMVT